jgi:hypothetical protein
MKNAFQPSERRGGRFLFALFASAMVPYCLAQSEPVRGEAAPSVPRVLRSHKALAAEHERQRLRDENGHIPPDGLQDAMEQARRLTYEESAWPGAARPRQRGAQPKVAGLSTNNWEWLGPGNIGGRIRAVAIHPTSPNIMWVGGVTGGIWKSTNAAASFFPVDDWMTSLAVTDIKVDPVDPNVLYATTGEDVRGAGIFKSVDGGNTWWRLPSTSYATHYNVMRLSISPANHLILLAAAGNGIWRSTDGGTNWTQTYTNASIAGRGQVVFHPTDGSKAIAMGSGTNRGLYSLDGGVTWIASTGLAASGRVEFGYAPSSPNIIYASQNVNGGTLYASSDGGVTYAQRSLATNYLVQGDWDNVVWVDPTNPNVVIAAGVDMYRSTDAGTNFTKISSWGENQIAQLNDRFSSAHADHHVLVSHPNFDSVTNPLIYNGNDGGLFAITNVYEVNETNSCWTNLNHHLGITQFYGGAGSPTTFTVQGGGQDNGHARGKAGEWTDRWHLMKGGDGGFCAVDPTDPTIFYGEYIYLEIARSNDEGQRTTDIFGGIGDAGIPPPWHDDPDLKPDNPLVPAKANFIAPFILDPNNPNTMLAGGSNLWRSLNVKASPVSNITWTVCMTNPGNGTFISAIAAQPGNSDIIWVGFNNGDIYATTNGTAVDPSWTRKDMGTPNLPDRKCQRIAIDATNPNFVYASFGGFNADNLYRTTDAGATWLNIATGLPVAPVNTVVIAPWNRTHLYVGTEVGVFASANGGASWSSANEGPANVRTDELFWLRNYLHAATYGRGMFRIALGPPTVVVSPATLVAYPGENVTFTASAIGAPTPALQWQYNGTNIAGATGVTYTVAGAQFGNSGRYSVAASNSQGTATATGTVSVVDSPPYRNQTQTNGPVGYWRLNEVTGPTVFDSIGGNHGTKTGSAVPGTNGPGAPVFPGFETGNTAWQLPGSSSIAIPALNLNSTNLTITAWVRHNGTQYFPGIVSWSSGGTTIMLGFGNNDARLTYLRNGFPYNSSSLTVPDNQWTFVALVLNPSNEVIYMATNSTLASATFTRIDAPLTVFTNTALFGSSPYGSYNGGLDEVAIYNRALSPGEISNLVASATNLLPAVTLTTPVNGGGYLTPATINLAAAVATNGHSIVKVQFFSGTNLLAEDVTPPYSHSLSSLPHGTYTFFARLFYDGGLTVNSLPAHVAVTNLPPVAMADSATTVQNSAVTINVLANDNTPGGFPLSLQSVGQPFFGTAVVSGTNITYTPGSFFIGTDTFTYTITDGQFDTATATVTVTVSPPTATLGILGSTLRTNLVVYLPFDDDFYDYSTRGNHPGQSNVNLRAAGNLGASGYVLTNGGYLSFGLAPDLHFADDTVGNTNSFSISFWAKCPSGSFTGAPPYIANKDWSLDGNTGWALAAGPNSGGNGFFQMSFKEPNANLREYDSTNAALTNGNWHHYLVVFQRNGTRTCFTYIDGALADSRTMFASGVNIDGAGLPLNIGRDGTGAGTRGIWTNALMDDFAFWRRALTTGEVTAIYSAGTNGYSLAFAQSVPVITNQPVDTAVPLGGTLNLSVGAISLAAPGYQWRTNGVAIAGATNAAFSKAGVTAADFAGYDVVVTNLYGSTTSRLAAVTMGNLPPVPGVVAMGTVMNQSATLSTAKIIQRATDPEGDTLAVTAVSATSTNGGTVSLVGSNITYTPVSGYVGADLFTYTLNDGHGNSVTGAVTVEVLDGQTFNFVSASALPGGQVQVKFFGIPSYVYALDWTHDLTPPVTWLPLQTNPAGGTGQILFTNTPSGSNDFYRTRAVSGP